MTHATPHGHGATPDSPAPVWSVVVPTRARPEPLLRCLRALAAQPTEAARYEVIVVYDGSPALPAAALATLPPALRLVAVEQPWGGPAAARNTGIAHARGRWIAFTDDDCAPSPSWLEALEARLRSHPDALVGGRVVNARHDDTFAEASQLLVDYLYAWFDARGARVPAFFTSNNFAGDAARIRAIGGFARTFRLPAGEDRDFCDRWTAAGGALSSCADAVVEHFHAMTWRSFTRQHLNYGRGAWTFHGARAERGGGRRELAPLRFYAGILRAPWRLRNARRLRLAALLAWSQVVNATGYALEALRSGRPRG